MGKRIKRITQVAGLCVVLATLTPSFLQAQTAPPREREKIDTLIKIVSGLENARFIRNGSTYNAASAANFLRLKWQANDLIVKTARDFIDKVASMSGTSGKPYRILMKDGTEINSREFLLRELEKLEASVANERDGR